MNEIIKKAYEYFKDINKARLWYRIWNPVLNMSPKEAAKINKGILLRVMG